MTEGDPADGEQRTRRLALGVTGITVLAVLVSSVIALQDGAPYTTDWALIEMRVRAVGSSWPLVGAPSNFGLHHLGPMEYYLLAPAYRLLGQTPESLGFGVAVINSIAIATCGWLAWRRGRLALVVLTMVGLTSMAASLTAGFLVDHWNPWVALFPGVAFLLAAWSVIEDDQAALPVLVLTGSWTTQAHFSWVVVVGPLALAAVSIMIGRAVVRRQRMPLVLPAVSLVLVAICWAPPVIDEVANRPDGNLSATVAHFADPPEETGTLDAGTIVGLAATELGFRSPPLTGAEPINVFLDGVKTRPAAELLPTLVLAAAAAAVAIRRGDGPSRRFLTVAAAAAILALAGVSRLEPDRAFIHVMRYLWAVDLVLLLAIAWVVTNAGRGRRPNIDRLAVGFGVAVVLLNLVRLVAGAPSVRLPINQPVQQEAVSYCVTELTAAALDIISTPAHVHLETEEYWPVAAAGIANELERADATLDLGPRLAFYANVEPSDPSIERTNRSLPAFLVVDDTGLSTIDKRPGWHVIAVCDPLTNAERNELTLFPYIANPSQEEIKRAFELQSRSSRYGFLKETGDRANGRPAMALEPG